MQGQDTLTGIRINVYKPKNRQKIWLCNDASKIRLKSHITMLYMWKWNEEVNVKYNQNTALQRTLSIPHNRTPENIWSKNNWSRSAHRHLFYQLNIAREISEYIKAANHKSIQLCNKPTWLPHNTGLLFTLALLQFQEYQQGRSLMVYECKNIHDRKSVNQTFFLPFEISPRHLYCWYVLL